MDIESLITQLDSSQAIPNIHLSANSSFLKTNDELEEIQKFSLPKIKIIGVGGAGNNFATALHKSINGSNIVEVIAMNTDASQLAVTKADRRFLIGKNTTRGYGAGNDPALGSKAFEESKENISKIIENTDLLIVVAGLGGGTGSGVAPRLVELAYDMDILTVTFVTMPFRCEGKVRIENALRALNTILHYPIVTIVIPNERLVKIAPRKTIHGAFDLANNLLIQLVSSLSDLIEKPGLINVDFADVKKILSYPGLAIPGIASANDPDEKRALTVTEKIFNNPLLEVNPSLAKGALIEIVGGEDLLLTEAYDIVNKFTTTMGENKEIIFGLRIQPEFKQSLRVVSLMTGIEVRDNLVTDTEFDIPAIRDIESIATIETIDTIKK